MQYKLLLNYELYNISGKGVVILKEPYILRQKPAFEEIYCIHPDGEYTAEWDDVDTVMLSEIPPPDQFAGLVKKLVILDDLELNSMGREQSAHLDRFYMVTVQPIRI